MLRNRCVLFGLIMASLPVSVFGQGANYWLIEQATGRWEYRVGTEKPRKVTGPYDPIFPQGEVRCLEADLQACELRFLVNPRSNATERLAIRLTQTGQWASLRRLKPPPPPVLPTTSSELAAKFARVTRAGGSRAASGCGGDFSLEAPACGENVAVSNFKIRWPPMPSGKMAVLVERADGAVALFRATASADAGEFADPGLDAFLRKVQGQNDPVDVTVRILVDGGKSAVRLVHVLPSSRTDDYEARVRALDAQRGAAAVVTRMSLAMEEGIWSTAAEHASELVRLAAGSRSLLEYAVVGLCQSDFDEERALLQTSIRPDRFAELCVAEPTASPATSTDTAAGPEAASPAAPGANVVPKARAGIALLIGNSEYWNMPLNSVKSDLKGMSATLASAGFAVTTKENLRSPRQFVEALDDVLKKENATPDDLLLVYYSGHGLQLDGKAHLLSTGVSPAARVAEDLRDNAQSAEDLLAQMERAIPGARVLIIEACRDNVLSGGQGSKQAERGGFAFQQDDVANTFVMFANKPGLPTPVRSDYGLMGPFTEALMYALENSTGDVLDVYEMAATKTAEISPGQEPVMYRSKTVDRLPLKRDNATLQDTRARDLLNSAEALYRARAWDEFHATVTRGKALASETPLQQRLARETEFARLMMEAERAEEQANWAGAAASWQKGRDLFAVREWVSMKAAVAWLLADDLAGGVRALAVLSAQSDSEVAVQARQMLADLVKEFPALDADARKAAEATVKAVPGAEFEKIQDEE